MKEFENFTDFMAYYMSLQDADITLDITHRRHKVGSYNNANLKLNDELEICQSELQSYKEKDKLSVGYIKELEAELENYKTKYKNTKEEKTEEIQTYIGYIEELEKELENYKNRGTGEEDKVNKSLGKGKALELSYRVLCEALCGYGMGMTTYKIAAETGASRGQIDRILKGTLKHEASRKKVLRAVNHLLKINQNSVFLDRLKQIKALYT